MKKLTTLLFLVSLVAACSAPPPNLVSTHKPILNIEADLAALIEADTTSHSVLIKNKTEQPLRLNYGVFWYDKNGVTQLEPQNLSTLFLAEKQRVNIEMTPPSVESVNYRLYLRLKP